VHVQAPFNKWLNSCLGLLNYCSCDVFQDKKKTRLKEKIDKYPKDKLCEFCDLLDIPVSKASTKKVYFSLNFFFERINANFSLESFQNVGGSIFTRAFFYVIFFWIWY
jgi:Zn-finger domain-containing protein